MAEDLRHRYAEALAATCRLHETVGGCDRCERRLAAVMAVRDEELERLRRENEQWAATYGRHAQLRIQEALLIAALDSQDTDRG